MDFDQFADNRIPHSLQKIGASAANPANILENPRYVP